MASFRRFRRQFLPFLPTGAQIRRIRSQLLRRVGLARTHDPTVLVQRDDWRIRNILPYVAADLVCKKGEITFLQIGAFDGVADDDLRAVIDRYPSRGILVEPQPAVFEMLKKNYQKHPQLELVNAAVDRTSGTREFYTTAAGCSTVASFDRSHLLKHGVAARDVQVQQVECLTIPDLLERYQFDSVDLLQIDAEGYDYEIIKSIDFAHFKPAILRFEFAHFSRRDINQCIRDLALHGYRFLVENKDVIAIQESSPGVREVQIANAA